MKAHAPAQSDEIPPLPETLPFRTLVCEISFHSSPILICAVTVDLLAEDSLNTSVYSINAAKSDEYKGSNGAGLNTAAVKNRTTLAKLSDFDYDNATVTSIASEISASLIVKEDFM